MTADLHAPVAARRERLRWPLAVGATGIAAVATLGLRDPHASGSYGHCLFLLITGQPCPACGGLRAVHDLTRLDLVGAVSSNVLAVLVVIGGTAAWFAWLWRSWRGVPGPVLALERRHAIVILAVVGIFGVFRVTPWGAWLAP